MESEIVSSDDTRKRAREAQQEDDEVRAVWEPRLPVHRVNKMFPVCVCTQLNDGQRSPKRAKLASSDDDDDHTHSEEDHQVAAATEPPAAATEDELLAALSAAKPSSAPADGQAQKALVRCLVEEHQVCFLWTKPMC